MAWGVDLWDQFDAVERHTGWGLEFLERLSKFVRERADVEAAYAKQLRNLQKKYLPKRVTEEEKSYTSCRAFFATLHQLGEYAGHHEQLADTLADRVVGSLARYHAEAKQQRKALLFEGRRAQRHLDTCWKQVEESKRKCERDTRESDRARQTMQRHDCDPNSSRADVEKARTAAAARKRAAEDSRADFVGQRDGFNREQADHFYSVMPALFHELEEMEACRLSKVREYLRRYADAELKVLPAIGGCLDEVARAADSINERQDCHTVARLYRSGYERPRDLDVEDSPPRLPHGSPAVPLRLRASP
uniref:Formin-binding protein 1-like n=1 Tax=Petromyzon marinus TaxID=7757 RepID=A0AAJ7XJN2_PETMA|nr:formin-binding protein 1-like [Petromyzon marinus]